VKLALFGLILMFAGMRQNPASVSGYVLEATTSRPIAGATVSIHTRLQNPLTAKTEADGSFRFDSVPPGAHGISASKDGYVSFADRYAGRQMTFSVGEHRTDVVLRLQGTGTLSGRVLDSNGRPVVQASVRVFRFVYHDVQREPSGVALISDRATNDRGEFRVFDIPSGQYLLLATPKPIEPDSVGAALYPGVREIARAEPIEVRAEQETRLRDLTMPLPMRGAIRLRVINATGRSLPARVNIGVAGTDTFLAVLERPGRTPDIREFKPSLIGSYVFHAAFQTATGNIAGYAKVEYSGADVDAEFVLGKLDGQIKGRALLERPDGSTQPLAGAEMEFYGMSAESAFSKPDGTFTIGGLLKGPFRFSGSFEMPKGYYVASVRERDRDLLRESLVVVENTPEVEVRVRVDGGLLEGKVTDSRLRIVPEGVVALIPQAVLETRSDRHNTYRIGRTDATGAFELRDIIPGEYLIYAWSSVPEGAMMDPWFMERYKGKGLPVKVEGNGRLKMDLTILDE
jgi:hypothetical protein